MEKNKTLVFIFSGLTLLLTILVTILIIINSKTSENQNFAFEAVSVISAWNRIDNYTNDLLLSRYIQTGREPSHILVTWQQEIEQFDVLFTGFIESKKLEQLGNETIKLMQSAAAFWQNAKIKFIESKEYIDTILETGLGERLMVNGFLHTMYKMRMSNLLSTQEIFLIEDALFTVESLDASIREFDNILQKLTGNLRNEIETDISRTTWISIVTIIGFIFLSLVMVLFIIRYQKGEQRRKIALELERAGLILSILNNTDDPLSNQVRNKCSELGIKINFKNPVRMILFQIKNFREFSNTYNIKEQLGYVNILKEFIIEIFNKKYDNVTVVLPETESTICLINTCIHSGLNEICEQINLILKGWHDKTGIELRVVVSDINEIPEEIDLVYNSLKQTALYRFINPDNILTTEVLIKDNTEDYLYPIKKEIRLQEAILTGNIETAKEIYTNIMQETLKHPPNIAKTTVMNISAVLSYSFHTLEKSPGLHFKEDIISSISELNTLNSIMEVNKKVFELMDNLKHLLEEKLNNRMNKTINKVKEYIENEYKNINLCSELIAGYFNLSGSYLNRHFKKITGYSIAGYINNFRLEKSKDILKEKNCNVAEIPAQVGFSNTVTYYRLFKNSYGLTPGEYQTKYNMSKNEY